jgi:Polyketide cyclase / dehydrase and lipid transport
MLRLALISLAILVVLVVALVAVGYALPVGHVATRQATLPRSADAVFATLSDVAHFADWRTDVTSVDVLSTEPLRWREHGSNGDITFVVVESVRPLHLVTRIDDPALPFGGTWSYDLVPSGTGTTVTITERGEVYNPVFRVMSRFVFGHTATIDGFLTALTRLAR